MRYTYTNLLRMAFSFADSNHGSRDRWEALPRRPPKFFLPPLTKGPGTCRESCVAGVLFTTNARNTGLPGRVALATLTERRRKGREPRVLQSTAGVSFDAVLLSLPRPNF
jgi:hypothetical protein